MHAPAGIGQEEATQTEVAAEGQDPTPIIDLPDPDEDPTGDS